MNKLSEEKERVAESYPSTLSNEVTSIPEHDNDIEQPSTSSIREERLCDNYSSTTRTSRGPKTTRDSLCNALYHEKTPRSLLDNFKKGMFNTTIFAFVCIFGLCVALFVFFNLDQKPKYSYDGQNKPERWSRTGQNGLNIIIYNALEKRWHPYFHEYVQQWDNGEPDSLRLKTIRVAVDSNCNARIGRIKVCNGNYGDTEWYGVNLLLMRNGYIRASTAKMNDYYLQTETKSRKRFTMCHEMGHAFGLAHTDENHHNANLGDCMDYTTRPEGNLSPGEYNHQILAQIYGTIPSKSRQLKDAEEDDPPEAVIARYKNALERIEHNNDSNCDNEGRCVEDLGEGYQMIVNKFLIHQDWKHDTSNTIDKIKKL